MNLFVKKIFKILNPWLPIEMIKQIAFVKYFSFFKLEGETYDLQHSKLFRRDDQ